MSSNGTLSFGAAPDSTPLVEMSSNQSNLVVTWQNITYAIEVKLSKGKPMVKEIISGVNGGVKAGEMVAIMGASGSGKTSLLNSIAGRVSASAEFSGTVLVNGHSREALPSSWWKRSVGFSEQEDIYLTNLTVRETLFYQARLRAPQVDDIQRLVDELLEEMGLTKVAHSRIGNPEQGGISGGEKKRLSIAIEIITKPKMLFADEPTSGLDAASAFSVIEVLKKLTSSHNMAILCTIHQPRKTILDLFDKIHLLAGGRTVWFGTVDDAVPHFATLGFPLPPQTNPGDYFLDVLSGAASSGKQAASTGSVDSPTALIEAWAFIERTRISKENYASQSVVVPLEDLSMHTKNSMTSEFFILLSRQGRHVFRDRSLLPTIVGNTAVFAILMGFIFFRLGYSQGDVQSRFGLLQFLPMNGAFSSVMPLLANFTESKRLMVRERRAGAYSIFSRFLAELVVNGPVSFLGPFLSAIIIYWMTGLNPLASRFGIFVVVNALNVLAWISLGYSVGGMISNMQIAQMIFPMIATLSMLFGGGLVNQLSIPIALRWIQWLSVTRYVFTALLNNEFQGVTFSCVQGACQFPTGESVISFFNLESPSILVNIMVLLGACIAFLILAVFGLHMATSIPQKRRKLRVAAESKVPDA
ncbi:hypothetical protein HDU93_008907 [Gonapodya sp. JEL0774]|nr:hypothetical protein HDU93_008907 [Gonapodya sp. JEL0774]